MRDRDDVARAGRKFFRAFLVAFAVLLLAGATYLAFGDLGWLRGPLEARAGAAIGRELKVNGSFSLELLPSPRLVAEDVTLDGAGWGTEPFLLRVDRLRLEVGLRSLLAGPVRVKDLEVRGARVHLERDGEGRASWDLGFEDRRDDVAADRPREPAVLWERIRVEDVELIYREPSRERPVRLVVDRLDAGPDGHGLFAVRLDGRSGQVDLNLRGHVEEIEALRGLDLELSASGPDIATVTDLFELPSLGSGPFELSGSAGSGSRGVDLSFRADLVELQVDAHGRVDSMIDPRDLELEWNVSGADLRAAGALVGRDRLPRGPFEVSGRLSGDGVRTTLDRLQARVGDHRVSVQGVLRAASSFVDRDLGFEMAGPDLSAFSDLAGLRLPARRYGLTGRLVRHGKRIEIAPLTGKLGGIDIRASGLIDEELRPVRVELDFNVAGPDLLALELLTGRIVPPGPFEIEGRLATEPSGLILREVRGRAGRTAFEVDGKLVPAGRLAGSDFRVSVAGPDPFWLTPLFGSRPLPVAPYEVGGRVLVKHGGYDLEAVAGSYGDVTFGLDGRLGPPPTFASSDLRFRISGSDLSWPASLGGVDGLPAEPFDLAGRVRRLKDGYGLDSVEASIGGIDVVASGTLADLPRIDGSDLEFEVHGPDLSALSRYPDVPSLPSERFTVSGRVRAASGTYRLERISGELGRHRFAVAGELAPGSGLAGSDIELQISGPDLADAARCAEEAGLGELPHLPRTKYSLDGHVHVGESDYEIERLIARVADAEARIEGRLGRRAHAVGSDVSIVARGADASILPAVGGWSFPQQPFSLEGHAERVETGLRLRGVEIKLGGHRATIDGILGNPPGLAATRLDVRAEGPDLSMLGGVVDRHVPSDLPFEAAAHLEGGAEHFTMHELRARLGTSDVAGHLEIDLRGDRLFLQGELDSGRLALGDLVTSDGSDDRDGASGLLLPDDPLELGWLDRLDASVHWTADELIHRRGVLGNVELALHLAEGRLRLDRARAAGQDGVYTMSLDVAPVGDGYRLEFQGRAEQARLSLFPFSGDPAEIAPLDLEIRLTGTGDSIHSIAASADGRIRLVQGPGKIDNSALNTLGTGVLSKLFGTLNPFIKEEPFTELECSVLLAEIEDGIARLGPLALRTDRMVDVGRGEIDFETEKLTLHWAVKPRNGVGLSASAITNSYIKLGGTLSAPKLTISPLKAARATGAAIFTGGLSILGRAVYDRVTAERNVCRQALEIEEKRERKKGGTPEVGR